MRRVASLSQEVLRVSGPGKQGINRPAEASPHSFPKEQDPSPDAPAPELASPGGKDCHPDLITLSPGFAGPT